MVGPTALQQRTCARDHDGQVSTCTAHHAIVAANIFACHQISPSTSPSAAKDYSIGASHASCIDHAVTFEATCTVTTARKTGSESASTRDQIAT